MPKEAIMLENTAIVLLLIATWYLAQIAIYLFAKLEYFWIILEEGYAVAIKKNGAFFKMLLSYTGYAFAKTLPSSLSEKHDSLDIYLVQPSHNHENYRPWILWILNILIPIRGIKLIGVPGLSEVSERVLVRTFVHKLGMEDIVLQGGIPYRIDLLLTLQVTNPAKALLRVDNYFGACLEQIYGWSRNEFSPLSFDNFVRRAAGAVGEDHRSKIPDELDAALSGILEKTKILEQHFGVTIHEIQLTGINPSNEEMRAVIIQQEVARQKAAASITKARAEADSLIIVDRAARKLGGNTMRLTELHTIDKGRVQLTVLGRDISIPPVLPLSPSKKRK